MYKYDKDLTDVMNRYHLDYCIKYYPIKKKNKLKLNFKNYIIMTCLALIVIYFLLW